MGLLGFFSDSVDSIVGDLSRIGERLRRHEEVKAEEVMDLSEQLREATNERDRAASVAKKLEALLS